MITWSSFVDSPLFYWGVMPFLIFLARICDQSIGTLRVIFLSKGVKALVPILGFFEVLIWLLAIRQIMSHLDNWLCYIGYAAGFATGNVIGMYLDEKLSIGKVIIRVIPRNNPIELIKYLREENFGLTVTDAEGSMGKVKVIFSIINRKQLKNFIEIINRFDDHSFYSVEEVKAVNEGVFKQKLNRTSFLNFLNFQVRKGK